jgi:ethanolamine utilization protein EutA (predicted chaperonin)
MKAGLTVDVLTLEPLASAAAVLSEEEREAGVVLVDIGGGTTDIAIFQDGIIRHSAVIPFGGNAITDDIKQGCTIMKGQAEQLKVRFGSALATENKEIEIIVIPGLPGRDPKEISSRNLAQIIQVVILVKIWLKSSRLSFWSKFGPKIMSNILFFLILAKVIKYTDAFSSVQKNSRKKHYFFPIAFICNVIVLR